MRNGNPGRRKGGEECLKLARGEEVKPIHQECHSRGKLPDAGRCDRGGRERTFYGAGRHELVEHFAHGTQEETDEHGRRFAARPKIDALRAVGAKQP